MSSVALLLGEQHPRAHCSGRQLQTSDEELRTVQCPAHQPWAHTVPPYKFPKAQSYMVDRQVLVGSVSKPQTLSSCLC